MDAAGKVICNRDKYAAGEESSASKPADCYLFSIDRHALVTRHNVVLDAADPTTALQVGNGEIAFGVDVTGLQTFYGNTMSHWGWHSFSLPKGKRVDDFRLTPYDTYGRPAMPPAAKVKRTSINGCESILIGSISWLVLAAAARCRWQRGRLEPDSTGSAGTGSLQGLIIESRFVFDGQLCAWRLVPIRGMTWSPCALSSAAGDPRADGRRAGVSLRQPVHERAADWKRPNAHKTSLTLSDHQADFARHLDDARYAVRLNWSGRAVLKEEKKHTYVLLPDKRDIVLECVCTFANEKITDRPTTFSATKAASRAHWSQFWSSGGAIDLSASKDPRWSWN